MTVQYSNIPSKKSSSDSNQTVEFFNNYYREPIAVNYNNVSTMVGFFQNRGFDTAAAENCAIVILTQAAQDKYDPMQLLDTLKGLDNVEISGLVAEILNFNRINTSLLGTVQKFTPSIEVTRQVLT